MTLTSSNQPHDRPGCPPEPPDPAPVPGPPTGSRRDELVELLVLAEHGDLAASAAVAAWLATDPAARSAWLAIERVCHQARAWAGQRVEGEGQVRGEQFGQPGPGGAPAGTGHDPLEGAEQYAARRTRPRVRKGAGRRPVAEPSDEPSGAR